MSSTNSLSPTPSPPRANDANPPRFDFSFPPLRSHFCFLLSQFLLFSLLTLDFPPPLFQPTIARLFVMGGTIAQFPIGRQVSLPEHFDLPVTLESAHPLVKGLEWRVRLHDGTLNEAVTPGQREEKKVGQKQLI